MEALKLKETYINTIKNEGVNSNALLWLEADSLWGCGISLGPTVKILHLVYKLKVSKGLVDLPMHLN
ncbi:hypothetical protein BGX38DRAFT_1269868 [Terfezia claveryi]|nr:hypothetical protein BGX38DRAFT_1269868 [Terfezia claveryi]